MSYKEFREKAKIVEQAFAQRHLSNILWANDHQNMSEHWDVEGALNGKTLKFDVKGMKKKNRWDSKTQDECAWVEGTNVRGYPGWIKGRAHYIVFEREDCWLAVNRRSCWTLSRKNYQKIRTRLVRSPTISTKDPSGEGRIRSHSFLLRILKN